ncbi:MAG: TatD family nuclease-associated radical SAM protein [Endomicrobiia bacterium]
MKRPSIVYKYKNNLYINITNRCTMHCSYCIKYKWKWKFRGYNLKLNREPTYREIISAINRNLRGVKEYVFCGYGEPTIRFELLKKVAGYLKRKNKIVRINTNGHGNLINKRNICPEMKGLIDKISISLNADTPEKYFVLHRPKFGQKTFNSVLSFIKECKKYIPEVIMTTINLPDIDIRKCQKIAEKLKVKFVVRPYLEEYEDH